MLASRTIPLTWSFHPPLTPIRRYIFLQISSRFSASIKMGKIVNSSTKSLPAQPLPPAADSAVRKDPVMADGPLADTSHDYKTSLMLIGSIPVLLSGKSVKNYSVPLSPSCTPFVDKNPEFMSSSNHLTSPPTTTTSIEHINFKRRSRIDLGLAKASGDDCSVPSSNFENSGLPLTKKFSTAKLTTPHDESPQGSNSWKKKPASVNRPYNSPSNSNYDELPHGDGSNSWKKKPASVNRRYNSPSNSNYDELPHGDGSNSWKKKHASVNRPYNSPSNSNYDESPHDSNSWKKKPASVNRPYNSPSNSNYDAVGHKLDASVGSPMFKPFDICFSGRRNPDLIGATLPGENRESSIEMQEEGTKGGILGPGMVLLKNYITHDDQVEIVKVCREIGLGPGGFYQPGYANGAKLRLKMMCLGMDWDPQTYKYGKKRVIDGSKPPSIPNHFSELVIRAIQEAQCLIKKENRVWNVEDELPSMTPDICIVNFYTNNGKLGLHQDRDESRESLRKGLPVVSFSIGDSAEFLYGDERDADQAECVLLESGDVLIFGGESRHVFHGVSSVLPNSAPMELLRDTSLCPGRLNLTFRQY